MTRFHDQIFYLWKIAKNKADNTSILHTIKFYFPCYKWSIWPPLAARTTSIRYENSSQTRWRASGSIELIAVVIRCFKFSRSVGNGGTKALSFTNPLRKKNHKLWGQEIWEAFCWRVAMFVSVAARRLVVGLAASREIIEN